MATAQLFALLTNDWATTVLSQNLESETGSRARGDGVIHWEPALKLRNWKARVRSWHLAPMRRWHLPVLVLVAASLLGLIAILVSSASPALGTIPDWIAAIGTSMAAGYAVWIATEERRRTGKLVIASGAQTPWIRQENDVTIVRVQIANEGRHTARSVRVRTTLLQLQRAGHWEKPELVTGVDLAYDDGGRASDERCVDVPAGSSRYLRVMSISDREMRVLPRGPHRTTVTAYRFVFVATADNAQSVRVSLEIEANGPRVSAMTFLEPQDSDDPFHDSGREARVRSDAPGVRAAGNPRPHVDAVLPAD